jgi:acetyltransferase-like isoleucine patch superfamily enzyme
LGKVKVGNLCSLGGNCTILPKIRIGNNVIVGAGTVVTSDVPDNKLIVGVPGKIIKSL